MIPLFKVWMDPSVIAPVREVLLSGFIGQGVRVDEFEAQLSEYLGNPYVVTVNSGTSALHLAYRLAGIGPGTEVVTTPMTCLGYPSRVLLAGGKTMGIGQLVNKRIPAMVMAYNQETGAVEPKRVTGWIKLPADGVEWFRVHLKNGNGSNGKYGKRGVWATGDHEVLTRHGLRRVDQISSNDEIITIQRRPNRRQQELIDGSMLGDGSVCGHQRRGASRFVVMHTEAQSEWLSLKAKALQSIGGNVGDTPAKNQSKPSVYFQSSAGLYWNEQRARWYSSTGKKIVPDDLAITPLALAAWYLDDGSLTAAGGALFCTECFSHESIWRLFWKLTDYGFRPTVFHRKRKAFGILIGNGVDQEGSARRFFEIISPYVPPCMRYKLPGGTPPYDPTLWELGDSEVYYHPLTAIRADPPKSAKPGYVYCLQVEGHHNFFSADIAFSNCMATNEPLLERGARVVWADISPHTGNISPESVVKKITPATRGIVAVHWGGTPPPFHSLRAIAHHNGISLIEDCAQAFGAEYDGSRVGSLGTGGRFQCFSFQAIKLLTTVDGGALVCQNEADYKRAKLLRWYGMDREDKTRLELRCEADVTEHGYKFHMNDVNAVVGMANLASVPARLARVRENARWYDNELNRRWITRVRPTGWSAVHSSAYWLYTVLVDDPATFIPLMKARGVHTSPVHVRNDAHSCFAESRVPLPGVDEFVAHQVSIPVGAWVGDEDRETIMNAIQEYDKQ